MILFLISFFLFFLSFSFFFKVKQNKRKFLIWNEYVDIEDECWKEAIEEEEAERGKKMNDDEKYNLVRKINDIDYEDTHHILNIQLDNPILIVADFGLWNGRRNGYKIIDSSNIKDILMCQMDGICKWYCDGEDICCEEAHHDGTNYYIYREILSRTSSDEAIDAVFYGEKDYTLFTKSLAPYVSKVFGL